MSKCTSATETRWLLRLERACAVAGLVALLVCVAAGVAMRHAEVVAARQTASTASRDTVSVLGSVSHVTGLVEIPALHLRAPMTDGISKLELIQGVGHIPGSALPGGLGTMALAGHRDTFFRSLQRVSRGMEIRVSNGSETYAYQVDGMRIVKPEEVDVLDIGQEPSLVLITCYPFHYIGAAPQRFIVHARLLSLTPVSL